MDALTGEEFFTALADALRDEPLVPMIPQRWHVGQRPDRMGQPYDASRGSALRDDGDRRGARPGAAGYDRRLDSGEASYTSNGWRILPMDIGDYGTEYPLRGHRP